MVSTHTTPYLVCMFCLTQSSLYTEVVPLCIFLQDPHVEKKIVRIYGLKREGGELFKKDFRKLLSLE